MSLKRELDVVLEAVREAAELLRAEATRDGGPRGAGSKADVDDEMCELLVKRLGDAFPADTIRSEELPTREGTSGRVFDIDPHDGTSHFLRGHRDTSVSVALIQDERLLLGVVFAPLAAELTGPDGLLVDWVHGGPLRHDQRPLSPNAAPGQFDGESTVLASPRMRDEVRAWNTDVIAPARLVGCGSVATRAALVAIGRATSWHTLRNQLGSWDFAAGQALMEAAGGALVDLDGEPLRWSGGRPHPENTAHFFGARSPDLARDLAGRFRDAFERLGRS